MDARELRIGNLYNHVKSGVITLEADWISYFAKFPELLSGIQLNEEWLLRFGFKRQNNAFNGPDKNDFSLWNPPGESEFTFNDTVMCPKIDYVHQLQNLYFALTGSELTLKEKL